MKANTTESFSLRRIAIPAFGPSLLFGIGEGAILPVVPLVAKELGASVPTAALITALLGLGSLLNNIPASIVTARWGERWALVAAGVWSAIGMLLCLFAPQLAVFALGCFMVGMARGVYNLARQSYVTETVPITHRARALSTLGGVARVGQFTGPFLAALVIHLFGLNAAFGIGIFAVVCAAGVSFQVEELQHRARVAQAAAPATWVSVVKTHHRIFLTAGMAVLLVQAVRASRQVVIPLWADHLGLAPSLASMIYGLSGGIEMLLFYPAGKVMDSKGRRWIVLPSMVAMGIGLLAVPMTGSFAALLAAAMLIGVGNGIGAGMNMTLGADKAPHHGRTYFLGVWRLMADIGTCSGPGLLSLLTAFASLGAGIVMTGCISFAAAAMLFGITSTGATTRQGG